MAEEEEVKKYPPRIVLSTSLVIRMIGVALTMGSVLVSVTAFVVKTSFPSETAKQAYDMSIENKTRLENIESNLGSISIPSRLTKLETEYTQTLQNQKDIKQSLDNITNMMVSNYVNQNNQNREKR